MKMSWEEIKEAKRKLDRDHTKSLRGALDRMYDEMMGREEPGPLPSKAD